MATSEPTSTAAAPAIPRKAPIKKEAASPAAPVKKPVVAAKRAAKTAPAAAAKQTPAATKAASTSAVHVNSGASAKLVQQKIVNGKAAATAVLPVPEVKASKEKKQKMVRDSVTIPKAEYQALDAMKQRAAQLKTMVKKTELIRAGIKHLSSLADAAFLAAIADVPSLKTGRPTKG